MGLAANDSDSDLEYRVKAAYLYNFFKFVDWPSNITATGDAVQVCVAGADPFGRILDDSFANKATGGKPIRIIRLSGARNAAGCRVVFFGPMRRQALLEMLQRLDRSPVLSVGEGEDFLEFGGIVAFLVEDKKVRFKIEADRARRARLHISSQLLMLSRGAP